LYGGDDHELDCRYTRTCS